MSEAFKQSSNEIVQRYASHTMKNKNNSLGITNDETAATKSSPISSNTSSTNRHSTCDLSTALTTPSATTSQAQDIINTTKTGTNSSEFANTIKKTNTQALVH